MPGKVDLDQEAVVLARFRDHAICVERDINHMLPHAELIIAHAHSLKSVVCAVAPNALRP